MSTPTLLVQCEDAQARLIDVQGKSSIAINDPTPFVQYLKSEANMSVLKNMVVTGDGKTKNVNLTYFPRLLESSVTAATTRGCVATDQNGNLEKQYSIDTTDLQVSGEVILAKDLSRFCENNPDYILSRLAHHMNVIDRKVASVIAGEANALLGGWSADTVSTHTMSGDKIQVSTASSGEFKVGAWEEILSGTIMSGYNGVVGFGGNDIAQHVRLSNAGCCANNGLDVNEIYRQFGYAYAYDRRLASALGSLATQSLVMEPGALQIIDYTETPWKNGVMDFSAGYMSEQMMTPNGIAVDVFIKDDCGAVSINVYANVKLVGLPDDMFSTGDNFEGVTFVGGVVVSNS